MTYQSISKIFPSIGQKFQRRKWVSNCSTSIQWNIKDQIKLMNYTHMYKHVYISKTKTKYELKRQVAKGHDATFMNRYM